MALGEPAAAGERACDRCRERRVKCDKRHPSCLRCEKLGKPCPGYDKKRKFVDEGAALRKKYPLLDASPTESGPSSIDNVSSPLESDHLDSRAALTGSKRSFYSPTRPEEPSPSSLLSPTARHLSDPALQTQDLRQHPSLPKTSPPGGDGSTWTTANLDTLPRVTAVDPSTASNAGADGQNLETDPAYYDFFNDTSLDPAWFDILPTDYYTYNGNSCGFLSTVPDIVDEIDRNPAVPSIEKTADPPNPLSAIAAEPIDESWMQQLSTSALIVDQREHEMAYLIRHFREAIGPWMDLFDQEEHFGNLVPLKALRDALLRNAIAAVAAKQLGRVASAKPHLHNQHQKPAMMEVIDEGDWFYKAANYYDKAIAFSRIYLQAISNTFDNPQSPNTLQQAAMAGSDDLLVAVSIFSLYEWLDNVDLDWLQHLSGLRTLLSTLSTEERPESDMFITSSITVGRRASFWNFTRADYHAAYTNHQATFLDTEDLHLWHSCGLQIQSGGSSLYSDPSKVKEDPLHCRQIAELVAHTMLWLVLRVMNYLASPQPRDHDAWKQLTRQLDEWHNTLPATFQPCAQMRYPVRSQNSASTSPQLTEVFFSMNVCAAALQLYHFARILLLQNRPARDADEHTHSDHIRIPDQTHTEKRKESTLIFHAHQIIGIALGRPHPAVRVEMLLPLYAAGMCVQAEEERHVVLELLRAIEKDTGCSTQSRCGELMREWKWSEGEVVMAVN